MALVSVIISMYNSEKYINRCLDSVFSQIHQDLEVILIDDGSRDRSYQKVKRYFSDKRFNYYYQENSGQGAARNFALKHISEKSEYLLFLDSDDWLDRNYFNEAIDALADNKNDVAIFNIKRISEDGIFLDITGNDFVTARSMIGNKFFRSDIWHGINFPEGIWFEDLGIIPYFLTNKFNQIKIEEAYYNYYISREDSQTNTVDINRFIDIFKSLDYLKNLLENKDLFESHINEYKELLEEHILKNTLLKKTLMIETRLQRKKFHQAMKVEFDKTLLSGNKIFKHGGIKGFVMRHASYFYLNGYMLLGDFIWKYPKLFLRKIKEM